MPTQTSIQSRSIFNGSADCFDPDEVRLHPLVQPPAHLPRQLSVTHPIRAVERSIVPILDSNPGAIAYTLVAAQATVKAFPKGVDLARDVDGGGGIHTYPTMALFTDWVPVEDDGSFVRLAEARTASQGGSAIRAVVMSGLALERTVNPDETDDIRNIRTMFVLAPAQARGPYGKDRDGVSNNIGYDTTSNPREAQIFDIAQAEDNGPFYAGPLYSGHPNLVTGEAPIERVVTFTEELIRIIAK